ncbi:MAG: ATP-binding cassette domain-containing protein, partial [Nitrososphaerales archaeon]
MYAVETKDLTKAFGSLVAVDKVSFTLEEGEIFGFLGPNGAGKTTTINMLTTLQKPTSGIAKVAGFDVVKESDKVRRSLGLVPQDLTVDEDLTGWENMMLQSKLYHVPSDVAKERAVVVLELVDLLDAVDRKVDTYSGGMRKRLELAEGLIHYPKVLFLDEPTLGLDVQTRSVMWQYIKRLREEQKMTIFLTTHYMDEADKLCDRIAIIDHGKIVTTGTPYQLKDDLGGDLIDLKLTDGAPDLTKVLSSIPLTGDVKRNGASYRIRVRKGEEAV